MKNKTFAICDEEEDYAYVLMEYFNDSKNLLFRAQAFTSMEVLKAYLKEHTIDLLLVAAAYIGRFDTKNIECVIVLSEGEANNQNQTYPYLFKYQPAIMLMQEALLMYSEIKGDPLQQIKKKAEFIGVYSPLGRIGKTTFSLTLVQKLAQSKKTLFLSLESFAAFTGWFGNTYQNDLSDVIYYYRQNNKNFNLRLEEMIQTYQSFSYLPPVKNASDLWEITKEDMMGLLTQIDRDSDYEVIVIDFGAGAAGLFELLTMCNKVYVPVREDAISSAKLSEFETQIRQSDLEFSIERIMLPKHLSANNAFGQPEQLLWGQMGDYVRQLGYA